MQHVEVPAQQFSPRGSDAGVRGHCDAVDFGTTEIVGGVRQQFTCLGRILHVRSSAHTGFIWLLDGSLQCIQNELRRSCQRDTKSTRSNRLNALDVVEGGTHWLRKVFEER